MMIRAASWFPSTVLLMCIGSGVGNCLMGHIDGPDAIGEFSFHVKPRCGEQSFQPINTNGSQRGGRPNFQFLPHRIKASSVRIEDGADLQPLITDNFVLLPLPRPFDRTRQYRVFYRADPVAE